jgi:hypothetical protein
MVYAGGEASYHFLRRRFASEVDALCREGNLRLHVIERNVHVFSLDERAATELNAVVSHWVQESFPATSEARAVAHA